MRLYPGKVSAIAKDMVDVLSASGDIEVLPEMVSEVVLDIESVLREYIRADREVTVFDSVGFALEDFSTLRFLNDLAAAQGVSERLSLIPALPDPKNLFGFLSAQNVPPQAADTRPEVAALQHRAA